MSQNRPNYDTGVSPDPVEIRPVLDALSDDRGAQLLTTLVSADEPLSAKELNARTDIPISTLYRKLGKLHETGVIDQLTEFSKDGAHARRYRPVIDEVRIAITEDGYRATLGDPGGGQRSR